MKKKILILANSSSGLYDFRNELVTALLERYEVVVSLPDTQKTDLLEKEGCRIEHTAINRRGTNPTQDLALLSHYRQLLQREKPDLVLTYTIKPNIYGGLACQKEHVPYLATITGLGSAFEKSGLFLELVKELYRTGIRGASCVFFQNRENMELFHASGLVRGRDLLVSGSGVNLDTWKPLPYPQGDSTLFLYVGRVMKEKGIREFLDAADALHGEKVTFAIVGYCEEDWQGILDAKKKEGILLQFDYQNDMHAFYERCSAVVLPTYHEGMSNVLMEASACARPVIASSISGCREIFEDGVTGFGFVPKSSEALIGALKKFLSLPQSARAAMGLSGREKMEREFDRRRVVEAYLGEIRRVLGDET
ncbi:MAG: glycosyltransferase family 4 protein [Lachnospiraceae bacterium]|jgi:galacturonosyltransferase|nr:glycosyltransferase family 4 protein [Lachnospiraceae bacterium]MCI1397772.1 glycosyltransferase family 4 protein [Lachnospiraceae bacterium]MCI1422877.1 glycosyltransferase family 4 protein [Lachnospiraceae bacterium]MCI1451606.1 glycosyltransferase family 4 protein [Lachnospiraceae bacterium]